MKRFTIIMAMALMMCGCNDFFEKDISSTEIKVIIPVEETLVMAGEVTFQWEKLAGAKSYVLLLASPTLDAPVKILADTVVFPDSTKWCVYYKHTLPAGQYQWSLRGVNGGYFTAIQVFDFTVIDQEEE